MSRNLSCDSAVRYFSVQVVKGQQLTLEVFDHDDPGDDEFLGRATVQTSVVAARGKVSFESLVNSSF